MIDLHKDLFVKLVLSAQKNKSLNKPFRVVHGERWDINPVKKITMPSKLDEAISFVPPTNNPSVVSKSRRVDKIDEKVEKIISDPVLLEIKAELEFAEALLQKIKEKDSNNPKISSIEQTVSQLKQLLEQKMYV